MSSNGRRTWRVAAWTGWGVALLAACMSAQPEPGPGAYRLGGIEGSCLGVPQFNGDEASTQWKNTIRRDGITFWLVQVSVSNRGLGRWQLRAVNPGNNVVAQISSDDIQAVPFEWWSPELENGASLEIQGDLRSLRLSVPQCVAGQPEPQLKSIIPPNDLKDITLFRQEPLYQWGRGVARLKVLDDKGYFSCTTFLVGPDLLLTNEHCTTARWKTMTAEFNFEKGNLGQVDPVPVVGIVTTDPRVDLALLRLARPTSYRVATVAMTNATDTTHLIVIQHPSGQEKQVAKDNCQVTPGATSPTQFAHICDTEKGSSGSPVFGEDGTVVGLHRKGFREGQPGGRNEAIVATEIRKFLATAP